MSKDGMTKVSPTVWLPDVVLSGKDTAEIAKGVLVIRWNRKGVGFGELAFGIGRDGKPFVDTEGMGLDFAMELIREALDPWDDTRLAPPQETP